MGSDFLKQMRARDLASQKQSPMGAVPEITAKDPLKERRARDLALQNSSGSQSRAAVTGSGGKFYSPEKLFEEMNSARAALQRSQSDYETINRELESEYSWVKDRKSKIDLLDGKLTTQFGLDQLEKLKQEYDGRLTTFQDLQSRAQSAFDTYRKDYERVSSLQTEYETWKGSIRRGLSSNEVHNLNREKEALEKANIQLNTDMASAGAFGIAGIQKQIDKNLARLQEIDAQLSNTPQADARKAEEKIAEITKMINGLGRVNRQLETDSTNVIVYGKVNPILNQIEANKSRIRELEQELAQAKADAAAANDEAKWNDYFRYADRMEEPDFTRLSGYRSTAGNKDGKTQSGDVVYEYINRNRDALETMHRLPQNALAWVEEMNDEEISIYNYVYAKEGREAAQEYLDHIKRNLTSRQRSGSEEIFRQAAQKNPALASAVSVAMTPLKAASWFGQTTQMLAEGRIDENADYNALSYSGSAIRDAVSEKVQEKWGPIGSFLYETGMSMGDFLITGAMSLGSSPIALGIMGSGAAADATIDAKDRGLSDKQAYTLGAVAGLAEIITEKISIDTLLDKTNMGKYAWGYIKKNMLAEGSEEMASELINLAADVIVSRDKSQWQQSIESYVAEGKSREQAFALAVADQTSNVLGAGLGGALSGGVMAGGNVILNGGKSPEADAQTPKAPQQPAQVNQPRTKEELIAQVKSYPPTPENNALVERMEQAESFEQAKEIHDAMYSNGASAAPQIDHSGDIAKERDRIVGQLRSDLRTQEQEEYAARLEKAQTETEITGVLANASAEAIESAGRMGKLLGKRVLFEHSTDAAVNGRYRQGEDIIWLNAASGNPVAQIIGHELTHSIEKAGSYADLHQLVMQRMSDTGTNPVSARKEIQARYKAKGVELTNAEADKEVVAEYIEKKLLSDETSIRQMVQDNRSMARRILDWLEGLLSRFTWKDSRSREHQFVLRARNLYRQALQESYAVHENHRKQTKLHEAKMEAYRQGDDAAGDALHDEEYAGDGGMESLLEDPNQFSYAGENAREADLNALQQARQMEEQDVDPETIRKSTGWFRGMEGKWRWEIDDSKMKYRRSGDAQFRKDHPEYARYQQLELKFLEGTLTGDELAEMQELGSIWKGERKRLADRVARGSAQLQNIIQHEKLFESYPWLRGVKVRFADLPMGTRGQWDQGSNTITLSNEIRSNPEGTLLHEIQHAIQDYEGFSGGSSEDYWRQQRAEIVETIAGARKNLDLWLEDIGYPEQLRESIRAVARKEKTMDQHWQDMKEFKESSPYARQIAACEAELAEFQRQYDEITGGMTVYDQYRNTAGEIEARDSTRRQSLDDQGRKNTPPDLGDEKTVFANDAAVAKDFAGWTADGNEVYQTSQSTMNLSTTDRIQKFKTDFVNNFRGRTAKFTRNGHTYYAHFSDKSSELGKLTHEGNAQSSRSSPSGYKAKIRMFADGNLFELVEDADYEDTAKETGGKNRSHKNAKYWDYYVKTIVVDGKAYDVLISVRLDAPQQGWDGKERYVYSVRFRDNKKAATSIASPATSKVRRQNDVATDYSIDDNDHEVKQYSISDGSGEEAPDPVSGMSWKAQSNLKGIERNLLNGIAKSLNVPWQAKREFLQPIVQEISREFLRTGKISQETVDTLFETAWQQGIVVDTEFYDTYKDVKDYLRTQAVTLSQTDRGDIPDYEGFKKDARYALRIKDEGGAPVDSFWGELREMAPELFPEHITHPADQLQRMLEVARDIRKVEYNLDQVYSGDPDFKRWARNDFEAAIDDAVAELRKVSRYEEDRQAQKKEEAHSDLTQEEVTALYPLLKEARRVYDRAMAKNLLTEEDRKQVGRLLRGDIGLENLQPGRDNVEGIKAVYEAKLEYEKYAQQIRQWNRSRKAQLMQQAAELTEGAAWWKDKRMGILYSRETMERNIRDIVTDKELAQKIIDTYFTPVHKAAAAANRLKNQYRDRIRALNLSGKAKNGHVSEAYAVQLLGEAEDNIRVMEKSRGRIKTRDGKTIDEWRAIIQELWTENPELDQQKIRAAVEEFRKIYDELFQQMNEARIRNGYEPVNYRQGYFPHFQAKDEEGIMALFGKALGIRTEVTALPTSINGLTHTFKPGIRWMGNALERKGFETAYDALEGFDRYIEGVADVIHQTDNIQRLRALAAQARYNSTDEGIRRQIDDIQARTDLAEEDKQNRIKEIWEKARYALSNFVVELEEYTNLLANKKSRADRNMEQAMGRDMYNLVKTLESRVAANMVAINPGSWLTNFIPLTQGAATLDSGLIFRGMWDTLKAIKDDDGFVDSSSFLINRRGSDPLVQTWQQKASAAMSKPMEWIDSFTADSLVRARYLQNIKHGLSEDAAIEEADQWAAGVMADRSKGSTPTLFNRSNPLTKLFTQFQLEVNNQLSYVFKDIPRAAGEKDKFLAALAAMLFKFVIGAFFYNEAYEYVIGRRPALDPLGILNDTVGDITGFELPNMVEFITGEDRDLRTEKVKGHVAAGNLATNVLEELPFIGSLMGGGRLPISSALPDWEQLSKAAFNDDWSAEKRIASAASELGNPLTYLALPFGGGQLKKILQGMKAVMEGGSYTVDSQGNDVLQYPIYADESMNALRAMIFGKTTVSTGVDWIESGFKNLSAKATAAYQGLLEADVDNRQAYEFIKAIADAKKTDSASADDMKRQIIQNYDISDECKIIAYYALVASDKEKTLIDELTGSGANDKEIFSTMMKIREGKTNNEKLSAVLKSGLDDKEMEVVVGHIRGTDLTTDKGNPTQYADYLEAVKAGMDPEKALRMQIEGTDLGDFLELTEAGLRADLAEKLIEKIHRLKPEEGSDRVTDIQKWRAACDVSANPKEQMAALEMVMDEGAYKKLSIGYDYGVDPAAYVRLREILPRYDANGSGSYSHDEIEAAIEGMSASGLVMAGGDGTIFYLTAAQKAALWQLFSTSSSAKNNPYDADTGWAVLEAKKGE